jgi:hypothetical protein
VRLAGSVAGRCLVVVHDEDMREAIRARMDELRQLLNDWDFIGVGECSAHDDEYDCLLGPLLSRLTGDAEPDEVAAFLRQEIEDHFGLDPRSIDIDDFAARAVTLWRGAAKTVRP